MMYNKVLRVVVKPVHVRICIWLRIIIKPKKGLLLYLYIVVSLTILFVGIIYLQGYRFMSVGTSKVVPNAEEAVKDINANAKL